MIPENLCKAASADKLLFRGRKLSYKLPCFVVCVRKEIVFNPSLFIWHRLFWIGLAFAQTQNSTYSARWKPSYLPNIHNNIPNNIPIIFIIIFLIFIRIIQETRVNFVCLSVVLEPSNFQFFYQGPKFYNTLNTNIINASSPFSFKRALKAFICNNY